MKTHTLILLALLPWPLLFGQNPNTAVFPNAIASDTDLPVASDSARTTLAAGINAAQTTLILSNATRFPTPVILSIDNEQLRCTSRAVATYTCTRGFNGTTAATHANLAVVHGNVTAWHYNQLAKEVQAIEAQTPDMLSDLAYATLGDACTASASNGKTLMIAKQWIPGATDCRTAKGVRFVSNGSLRPLTGQTVTLPRNVDCPVTQACYDLGLGGTVAFSAPPVPLSVVNFGADPTGTNDSSAAFLAAWKAGAPTTGSHVAIPCGTFKFSAAVTFTTAEKQSMQGAGDCTILNWPAPGNASASMLLFPNCFACEISNFYIDVNAALSAAVQTSNAGSGYTPTMDIFRSITIQGKSNVATCFLLDGPVDGNNDQQRFIDDHCYGYTSAGWQLGSATAGYNVLNVEMDHSSFIGFSPTGSSYGVWLRHGSYHWTDGDGGGNAVADFAMDTCGNNPIEIENGEFELSKQFIRTLASGALTCNLTVRNNLWDGSCLQQTAAQIASGCAGGPQPGETMSLNYNGPWVFIGNNIAPNARGTAATVGIGLDPGAFPGTYTFIGNKFGSNVTTNAALFHNALPTLSQGNEVCADPGPTCTVLPDVHNTPITFNKAVTFTVKPTLPNFTPTSWTPSLLFGGAATGMTYTTQTGNYFRIGDLTFLSVGITLSAKGSSAGVATIGGLPFTSNFGGFCQFNYNGNMTSVTVPQLPLILNGANYISLYAQGSTGGSYLQQTNFTDTSSLYGTCFYK